MRIIGRCALLGAIMAGGIGTAQAQISDDVVKLGVLTDMSSGYSQSSGEGSLVAARMAAEDFGGTVLGKPIQIVSGDHQNKPDIGSAIARRWIDAEQVDAVVDVPTSSVALAVQQITKEKNRVFLISGGGTSDLTGPACSPTTVHWSYDTYAFAVAAVRAMMKRGKDTWFFVGADYAFGKSLERDGSAEIARLGGQVLGVVHHPLGASDLSSFLLQAQASKAKVIALANAGSDTANALKQAAEFGLLQGDQVLLPLVFNIVDMHAIGLPLGGGLLMVDGFYWNRTDATRAWSERFFARHKAMPTLIQAGVYSAVSHYLKAIRAAGTDEAKSVVATMKATPIHDFFAEDGHIRPDGRMIHDLYLLRAKAPAASTGEWDLYDVVDTVAGKDAFRPLEQGGCPLVTKG